MGYSKYIEDIIDRWDEDTRGPNGPDGPGGQGGPAGQCGPASLFAPRNQSLRHAAHVVALGRFSNMGFLGDHGSLELSTLADTNHVVFFEHQPVAIDVDLAFPRRVQKQEFPGTMKRLAKRKPFWWRLWYARTVERGCLASGLRDT
jgi:hypothetical protein